MIVDEGTVWRITTANWLRCWNTHYLAPRRVLLTENTAAEQAARTVGAAQLPAAHHLQELQHLRAVFNAPFAMTGEKVWKLLVGVLVTFRQDTISWNSVFVSSSSINVQCLNYFLLCSEGGPEWRRDHSDHPSSAQSAPPLPAQETQERSGGPTAREGLFYAWNCSAKKSSCFSIFVYFSLCLFWHGWIFFFFFFTFPTSSIKGSIKYYYLINTIKKWFKICNIQCILSTVLINNKEPLFYVYMHQ